MYIKRVGVVSGSLITFKYKVEYVKMKYPPEAVNNVSKM